MNIEHLTDEDLDAWRVNPVTEMLRELVGLSLSAQKDAALQSYWAGNPWPPERAAAARIVTEMWEDFFDSSADDIRASMEQFDEYKRHQAD